MNPEVESALPGLVERGLIAPEQAALAGRIARGDLVSVRGELRTALYLGVLLVLAGVSLLVKENLDRIGPVGIAAGIGLAAALALFWVVRRGPAFTWGSDESPHLAFDYILLLGVLLVGADLAYIEWKFTPLGPAWSWHLLFMALFAGGMAVRYDSRVLWSLALSTFAAWRGVAVSFHAATHSLLGEVSDVVRVNAIVCGAFFIALGGLAKRFDRKAHFEPAAAYLGWLLVLGGLVAGSMNRIFGSQEVLNPWALATLLVGTGLAVWTVRQRRFWLFALGVIAAYIGLSVLMVRAMGSEFGCFWFWTTSTGVLVLLLVVYLKLGKGQDA
jgi:hypothetical protein